MNVFLATLALTSHRQLTSYQEQCAEGIETARAQFSKMGDYGDSMCEAMASTMEENYGAAFVGNSDCSFDFRAFGSASGCTAFLDVYGEMCTSIGECLQGDGVGGVGGGGGGTEPEVTEPQVPDDTEEDEPEEDEPEEDEPEEDDAEEDDAEEDDTIPDDAVMCAGADGYCDCSGDCTATKLSYCGCDEAVACCAANGVRAPHHHRQRPAPEAADPRPRPADPRPPDSVYRLSFPRTTSPFPARASAAR